MSLNIEKRCLAILKLQTNAEHAHIDAMYKLGELVLQVKAAKNYDHMDSAESDVSRTLKGLLAPRSGIDYVQACRRTITKLSESQRNMVRRYMLSMHDIIQLCKLEADRLRDCLEKIRNGEYLRVYTTGGSSYRLVEIYNPAVARRKGKRQRDRQLSVGNNPAQAYTTSHPDYVSARVCHNGLADQEAITDIFANLIRRFPALYADCWQNALIKCNVAQLRKVI